MRGPRAWITLLAGTSFLAGLAAGLLLAALRAEEPGSAGDFGGYRRRLVQQFELAPERAELLGVVLVNYEQDLARVRDQQTARSMETMEPELLELGSRYWSLIRERVIPPASRSEFDRYAEQNLVMLTTERES